MSDDRVPIEEYIVYPGPEGRDFVLAEMFERVKAERDDLRIHNGDGFTDAERVVADHLVEAVNAFGELERWHPDELREFVDGIHRCQDQLAWRIVQRTYPKGWPIKR